MLSWLGPVGSIILIDLILSGDNALVIGAAAAGLPRRQRLFAIIFGGGSAIILRIIFAVLATLLLQLPYLETFGAIILLVISVRLLVDRYKERRKQHTENGETPAEVERSFLASLLTILVADVTMSLDNILAVGALASGNLAILATGLFVSIALLLLSSALVAELVGRLPWLLDIACLILAWTAGNMILEDRQLGPILRQVSWISIAIYAFVLLLVLGIDVYLWILSRRLQPQEAPHDRAGVP